MFDTGSTGFMLIATSLVMIMTPGLAFFYGGLVGRKNVLAIMIQSFVSVSYTHLDVYKRQVHSDEKPAFIESIFDRANVFLLDLYEARAVEPLFSLPKSSATVPQEP